jgi:hypothetical protein
MGLWSYWHEEVSDLRMCLAKKVLMFSASHLVGPLVGAFGCLGGVGWWGFVVFSGFGSTPVGIHCSWS